MTSRRLGYQPALQGLRAVAVALVMAHHAADLFVPSRRFLGGGFIGVDVFFVLSGFLITTLLLQESAQESRIRLRLFYARRALRLFPALAVAAIVTATYSLAFGGQSGPTVARSLSAIALYATNWTMALHVDIVPGLGHTWSLAVEEQFYLVWPLVILLGTHRRWSQRRWVLTLIGLILASALTRAILWSGAGGDWQSVYYRTDARGDALLIGALLAVVRRHGVPLSMARWLLVPAVGFLGLAAAGGVALTTPALYYGGMTLIAAAAAVVVASLLGGPEVASGWLQSVLSTPTMRHFGEISYGLYLWHLPVFLVMYNHVDRAAWLRILLGVVVTVAAAELSMRYVERPFLRAKHRFEVAPTRDGALEQLASR